MVQTGKFGNTALEEHGGEGTEREREGDAAMREDHERGWQGARGKSDPPTTTHIETKQETR